MRDSGGDGFIWIIIFLLAMFWLTDSDATTRIAVMDTGLTSQQSIRDIIGPVLCKNGHYDYIDDEPTIGEDHEMHGTAVTLIIHGLLARAGITDYCFVIYKVYSSSQASLWDDALYRAVRDKVDYVNISLSGKASHFLERMAFNIASPNMKIYTSAGNKGITLTKHKCYIYPACYKVEPKLQVVGALDKNGDIASYSNRGYGVNRWDYGDIKIIAPNFTYEARGTSFASPKILAEDLINAKKEKRTASLQEM